MEDSIVKDIDRLEARCRYCSEWLSNRASRNIHEAKNHLEEDRNYATKFRDPESDEDGIQEEYLLADIVLG